MWFGDVFIDGVAVILFLLILFLLLFFGVVLWHILWDGMVSWRGVLPDAALCNGAQNIQRLCPPSIFLASNHVRIALIAAIAMRIRVVVVGVRVVVDVVVVVIRRLL